MAGLQAHVKSTSEAEAACLGRGVWHVQSEGTACCRCSDESNSLLVDASEVEEVGVLPSQPLHSGGAEQVLFLHCKHRTLADAHLPVRIGYVASHELHRSCREHSNGSGWHDGRQAVSAVCELDARCKWPYLVPRKKLQCNTNFMPCSTCTSLVRMRERDECFQYLRMSTVCWLACRDSSKAQGVLIQAPQDVDTPSHIGVEAFMYVGHRQVIKIA